MVGKVPNTIANLNVRRDAYNDESSFRSIQDLMNSIKDHSERLSSALNYLYGPRPLQASIELSGLKGGGIKAPTYAQFMDDGAGSTGVFLYSFSATSEEELFFTIHLHEYKGGTDITPHIHWAPDSTNTGNIVWSLEYTWIDPDESESNTNIVEVTAAASGVINQHTSTTFADLSGSGKLDDSIIIGRIFRKAADAADTYTGEAFGLAMTFHHSYLLVEV